MSATSKPLAFAALTLAGVCWGLGFPLGKLALREISASHLVLLRFAVAGIVALPFALTAEARALFRSPAMWLSGASYGLGFIVQFEGLAHVTVTLAALLIGLLPALVAIAARVMGERISRTSWIGVAGATIGAALIAGKPGGSGTPLGIALSLGSLLIFLVWLFAVKRVPATRSPMAVPSVALLMSTLFVAPISFALHGPPPLALSTTSWIGIVGSGLLSTLLATAAWSFGAAHVDSASAGVFINLEPLMGAVIGVALFGDPLGFGLLAGGVLILIGSITVVLGERTTPEVANLAAAGHGLGTE
ncbi:drug/metabolite transporter (DMT)-like permease [Sphingomonas vulcanisoli]|uniref:Drug/metabolite transporter (DMT)-like permease n=1 Tax=Sphingomonas vulcanisoli TaxID=1658060 RepID=A0ABX0TW88_9SPHN|nr:DMT family transporter [Sphingomonas vulcanisoli]NIJ07871.1 drug/metabolite transporter (DMT)-like permease [Sphingomonas vulcanisoli]